MGGVGKLNGRLEQRNSIASGHRSTILQRNGCDVCSVIMQVFPHLCFTLCVRQFRLSLNEWMGFNIAHREAPRLATI